MNQVEYQTVVLAGLLHDIGKFLQKAQDIDRHHALISKDFVSRFDVMRLGVESNLLAALVQHHYEGAKAKPEVHVEGTPSEFRTLALLLSRADNLSSSERAKAALYQRLKGEKDRLLPLASVFDQVALLRDVPTARHSYRLSPLWTSCAQIFPQEDLTQLDPDEVSHQVSDFESDFARLVEQALSFESLVTGVLTLLEQYTWATPSDANLPDVSLADHLRTTAAIATCLYQYHAKTGTLDEANIREDREPRFRLLIGDLSGIQSYLYDIATVGEEGVGRRLRARSLFVQLLSEVGARLTLERFTLSLANVLMAAGGNFYVLWPNLPGTDETVEVLQRQVDEWLLKHLNGEIALNLASVPFADGGFAAGGKSQGFGEVLEAAHTALTERKQRRFQMHLQRNGRWDDTSFVLEVDFAGQGACHSCGKFPTTSNDLCVHCRRDAEIGGQLPGTRALAFYNDKAGNIPLLGWTVKVLAESESPPGNPIMVATLGQLSVASKYPTVCWPPAPYTTDLRFEQMAERSEGTKLLGYLKADMDWLGQIFAYGLKRDSGESLDTPSRLTTLSRQLERFFNGWLRSFLQQKFPDCYTVFSGGDDLFIVGPWSDVVRLSGEVQREFARFVCHNPEISLSAGIVLVKPRYPLARAADLVGETLKQAKSNPMGVQRALAEATSKWGRELSAEEQQNITWANQRNRIALLGDVLTWDEYAKVLEERQTLVEERPTSAFLYSLSQYGGMWRAWRDQGDTSGLRYLPMLAYNVARNVPRRQSKLRKWADHLIKFPPDEETWVILDHLSLVASLTILSRRAKED
jgi:CRISPR-associated protein Csm1